MKTLLRFSAIFLLYLIGVSCSSHNDTPYTPVMVTFAADLTPVAGTGSMAHGNATLTLNQDAKTFQITVTYTGITPNHGHIHGADGAIVFPFPDAVVATSPIMLNFNITDAQMAELMANHYYVNLHTIAFPAGEISGTLIKTGTSGGGGGGGGGGY
ncbi:CHRD domain-containing protein [uncultured Flavobacterium sp.]|uniref:CHRD domain-containing protein n=1 Tax=uncultured Flavobacterium sp. TaxID=165435 RepID=UPI002930765E|nr:CHRD domain-containing protein [uncultured Flavobacterium sp.]